MARTCPSRRRFLRGAAGALACGGARVLLPQLGLLGTALAQSAPGGYKALVCVYLNGGNDAWNLLMPADSDRHGRYVSARNGLYDALANASGLAVPRPGDPGALPGQTLPEAIALNDGQYAVNPFAPGLAQLYDEGALAFISNIGTLIEPVTRATMFDRRTPPQLFSHNDQSALWRAGTADGSIVSEGWGGRIAGSVALPTASTAGLPPTISIAGGNRFLVGTGSDGLPLVPYTLSTSATQPAAELASYAADTGAGFQSQRRAALTELLDAAQPHLFSAAYRDTLERSIDLAENVINPAIAAIPADDPVNGGGATGFDWPEGNDLADQLRQVARVIRISRPGAGFGTAIDANRQVFYVNLGGFDTHDNQVQSPTAADGHHELLQQLSEAVTAFQRAMAAIGANDEVTLFSMSEFARTFNTNGNGTDHAWGGCQLVVGGAVNGGQVVGRYPEIVLDNALGDAGAVSAELGESLSRGQLLPTLAVDQLGATLARWMDVADAELPLIFPNIDNFAAGPYANATATPTFAVFDRIIPGLMTGV